MGMLSGHVGGPPRKLTAELLDVAERIARQEALTLGQIARKVHELEPLAAQTGPAVRYDENVIDEHLRMLADEPQMLELYREISENIHRLAIR